MVADLVLTTIAALTYFSETPWIKSRKQIPTQSGSLALLKQAAESPGISFLTIPLWKTAGGKHGKTEPNRLCRHRRPERHETPEIHPRWQRKQQPRQPPLCFS